jgi:hypothetical protein
MAKVSDTAFDIWRIPSIAVIKLIAVMKTEKNTTKRSLRE